MTFENRTSVRDMIGRLGGVRATARLLDCAPATVCRWNTQDRAPRVALFALRAALADSE